MPTPNPERTAVVSETFVPAGKIQNNAIADPIEIALAHLRRYLIPQAEGQNADLTEQTTITIRRMPGNGDVHITLEAMARA